MTETIVDKTVCDQTFEIATGQQQPKLLYDAKTEKTEVLTNLQLCKFVMRIVHEIKPPL